VFINDGQAEPMSAVTCPSLSQCTAVDYRGNEVTFDPAFARHWSAYQVAAGPLWGVACPSSSQCTAVGDGGREVTFDPLSIAGQTASVVDAGHSLQSVACPGVSQCTAADDVGREITFDPATPASAVAAPIGNGKIVAIACPSSAQCTAIDTGYSSSGSTVGPRQLITFDPAAAGNRHTLALPEVANNIACPSLGECVTTAVASCLSLSCPQGSTITFDPASNPAPALVTRSQNYFVSLACPSASQCTAMDASGQEVTFDPGSSSNTTQALVDTVGDWPKGTNSGRIACPSTSTCALVPSIATGSAEMTFDPLAPSTPPVVAIDDGAPHFALTCPRPSQCVAVGKIDGIYLPGDVGVSATLLPASRAWASGRPFVVGNPGGLACPTATQCTVVTKKDTCAGCGVFLHGLEATYNPRRPPPEGAFPRSHKIDDSGLTGVACPTTSQCTAIDGQGREVTFNPRQPRNRSLRRLEHARLTAVWCWSTTDCVAVDHAGGEVTFDPLNVTGRRPLRIDGHGALTGLSCSSSTQCAAVDRDGGEVTFDPSGRRDPRRRELDNHELRGVSCPSTTFCVAVDSAGRTIAGDPRSGAAWTTTELPGASALLSVFCTSERVCVASDADGHVFTGVG
jgi:hypothetical protein